MTKHPTGYEFGWFISTLILAAIVGTGFLLAKATAEAPAVVTEKTIDARDETIWIQAFCSALQGRWSDPAGCADSCLNGVRKRFRAAKDGK